MNDEEVNDGADAPLTSEEDQALRDNKAYWNTKELGFAGKIKDQFEFLPGHVAELHTLDSAEELLLGKILDREFGKVNQIVQGSSYQDGLRIITLSLAIDTYNGQPLWKPISEDEDVAYDNSVSIFAREQSLEKKSESARRPLHGWYSGSIKALWRDYHKLVDRKEAAVELLPLYSDRGEKLQS